MLISLDKCEQFFEDVIKDKNSLISLFSKNYYQENEESNTSKDLFNLIEFIALIISVTYVKIKIYVRNININENLDEFQIKEYNSVSFDSLEYVFILLKTILLKFTIKLNEVFFYFANKYQIKG